MANNIGIHELSINGRAPAGESTRDCWIMASSDASIMHDTSELQDLEAIAEDQCDVDIL